MIRRKPQTVAEGILTDTEKETLSLNRWMFKNKELVLKNITKLFHQTKEKNLTRTSMNPRGNWLNIPHTGKLYGQAPINNFWF